MLGRGESHKWGMARTKQTSPQRHRDIEKTSNQIKNMRKKLVKAGVGRRIRCYSGWPLLGRATEATSGWEL
jgi:hypothetical protein